MIGPDGLAAGLTERLESKSSSTPTEIPVSSTTLVSGLFPTFRVSSSHPDAINAHMAVISQGRHRALGLISSKAGVT